MSGGTYGWQGETLEFPAGVDSTRAMGVSPPGRARLRYNDVTKELEVSLDGGAYQVLSTGSDSPWVESPPGTVRLVTPTNDVVIGGTTPVSGAQLTVIGAEATAQLRLQQAGTSSWIELAPTVVGYPVMTIRADNVLLNGVENQVMVLGHNAAVGSRIDVTQVGDWLQLEHNFNATGAGPILSEFFWQWTSAAGTIIRPISAIVNWTTELATWGLSGSGVMLSTAGVQLAGMSEAGLLTTHAAVGGFHKSGNNTPILWGDKTAFAIVEILRIDPANLIQFDANSNFGGVQISSPGGLHMGGYTALPMPYASAILSSDTTARGWLPPRLTTAQRDAIATPADGLEVQNTDQAHVKNVRMNAVAAAGADLWVSYATVAYGSLSFAEDTTAFAPGAGLTLVAAWTDIGPVHQVTGSLVSESLTVAAAGVYAVSAQLTWLGESGDIYTMAVFVNGVQSRLFAGNQLGVLIQTMSISGQLTLAAGDVVDLRMSASGGGNIEMHHGQLNVEKISW